jgi:hypothetical protein
MTPLKAEKNVPRQSSMLASLLPLLDEYHLLRVGGRIEQADTPYDH